VILARGTRPDATTEDERSFEDLDHSAKVEDLFIRMAAMKESGVRVPSAWWRPIFDQRKVWSDKDPGPDNDIITPEFVDSVHEKLMHFEDLRSGQRGSASEMQDLQFIVDAYTEELFHNDLKKTYVSVRTGGAEGRLETYEIESAQFSAWLTAAYFRATGRAPSKRLLEDLQRLLAARALFDGAMRGVFIRVAAVDGEIWIDSARDDGAYFRVVGGSYSIEYECPHRFIRPDGMLPLPLPEDGGSLDELFDYVNVPEDERPLVLAFVLSIYAGTDAHTALAIVGDASSAKTSTARIIQRLTDPNAATDQSLPEQAEPVYISAETCHVLTYDNASYIGKKMTDELCRVLTGGTYTRRKHYTNGQPYIMRALNPLILTSIRHVIQRSDLLSRTISVHPDPIPPAKLRSPSELQEAFDAAHPRLLGALLRALAAGLAGKTTVVPTRDFPRFVEAAKVAIAAEAELGLAPGTMQQALERNKRLMENDAIEISSVAQVLVEFLQDAGGTYEGTASDLLADLTQVLPTTPGGYAVMRPSDWPGSAAVLSNMLRELQTPLRRVGVTAEQTQTSGSGSRKVWKLTYTEPSEEGTQEEEEPTTE